MFKNTKTNLIVRGILFITLGILCLFHAERITETIGTVIGLAIIIAGIVFFILGLKGYNTARAVKAMPLMMKLILLLLNMAYLSKGLLVAALLAPCGVAMLARMSVSAWMFFMR